MHFPTIAVVATTTALFAGQGLAASWRTYPASDPSKQSLKGGGLLLGVDMLMISDTAVEACRGQKLLSRCWYTVTYTAAPRREPKEKLAGSEFPRPFFHVYTLQQSF